MLCNFTKAQDLLLSAVVELFGEGAGVEKCQARNLFLIFKPGEWFHTAVLIDDELCAATETGDSETLKRIVLSEPYELVEKCPHCKQGTWLPKKGK